MPAPAQGIWREDFNGPTVSWRPARADLQFTVNLQRRIPRVGHAGQGAEEIRTSGANGTAIYFSHPVPPAHIASELIASVWVKADHPGLQIFGRAVLPRTIDPKTGAAATVLLAGSAYSQVGVWERLQLGNTPLLLERQARVLRLQLGPNVDTREAYIDQIWLNLYGGPGTTDALIDDLGLAGLVEVPARAIQQASAIQADAVQTLSGPPLAPRPRHDVRLDGSVLLVDGHPFFPRIFPYRGEPLANLSSAGFNAVRLSQPPTPALLAEAERAGVWLIGPPPMANGARAGSNFIPAIGPEFEPMLAWHLGDGLTAANLDATVAEVRQLRLADARAHRPIICGPDTELRPYSRQVDLLELSRLPLGTSLELADYAEWLRSRSSLARPGTPFWTAIQTQLWPITREQEVLVGGAAAPAEVDCKSIRLLTYMALTSGARGLEFQSERPFAAAPADVRLTLTLLNLELELLEPWATIGSNISLATSTDPQVVGFVVQTDRARLLIMMRLAAGSQHVPRPMATAPASIVVPGVPESHEVYELTPVGLRPINHKRVTGGTQVTIDEFQLSALVLLTPDPVVVNTLERRLAAMATRAADLQRELAVQTLLRLESIDRQLPPRPREAPQASEWLTKARTELADADRALAAGDRPTAYLSARKAMGPMEQYKRLRWEQAATTQNSPLVSPLVATFDTLPAHWRFVDELRSGRLSLNQLPAGDCENLGAMLQSGWRHFEHPQPSVASTVDLSPTVSHSGHFSLHLQVKPANKLEPPSLVETPPVWVTTASVPARRGQIVVMRGWTRVPIAITGSVDGLMILDSIGGEALAERALKTPGWREFVLYRIATHDGPVWVTFALTGLGDAWIDDVSMQTMSPVAAPIPPGMQAQGAAR
ncbi:MAG TPA: hypothetical protein VHX65_06310 [Pirellulales bacterium]|nr:hypothetical protein [Pirellulales bacterium]